MAGFLLLMPVAGVAHAITVADLTAQNSAFQIDFENGFTASAGAFTAGPDVSVTTSTTPPDPGPFQGLNYLRLFRNSDLNDQGNSFSSFAPITITGHVVRFSAMVFLPDDGAEARLQMLLDDGNFGNARAHVISGGNGHVIAETGPTFTEVDTGLTYAPNAWQEWDLQYTIGSSTFSVSVNGVTASGFLSTSTGQVSLGELFNGNRTPGQFYVDAVRPVPEPAVSGAVVCGMFILRVRRRRTG